MLRGERLGVQHLLELLRRSRCQLAVVLIEVIELVDVIDSSQHLGDIEVQIVLFLLVVRVSHKLILILDILLYVHLLIYTTLLFNGAKMFSLEIKSESLQNLLNHCF